MSSWDREDIKDNIDFENNEKTGSSETGDKIINGEPGGNGNLIPETNLHVRLTERNLKDFLLMQSETEQVPQTISIDTGEVKNLKTSIVVITDHKTVDNMNSCKVCGVPSKTFCGSCSTAYYCSKEHQKSDWRKHKRQCFPVISIWDEDNGRQLIATRNIKQGELILTESPIFITPNTRDKYGFTCLGCCNKIAAEKIVPCSNCGWALCSPQCEKEELHSQNECKIFRENGIQAKYKNLNLYQKYCEIGVLRMLLVKENYPDRWNQLAMLDDFAEFRKDTPDTIFEVTDMFTFIKNDCKLPFKDAVINQAFGILRANAFDTSDYTGFLQNFKLELKQTSLIFPTALMPGQSCIPNGHYVISGRQNGDYKISIIASIDISKGESFSIPYEDGFSGTFLRQEIKRNVFFQNCKCKRCGDPTELGTFLASLKCSKCKDGYYTQSNPLQKESDWNCINCSSKLYHYDAVDVLQKARGQIYGCMTSTSIEDSYKALKDLKNRILHPNNFLILQTETEICRRILTAIGLNEINNVRANDSYADILIETAKHLLAVADIVRPGFNRTRGRLLYCLQYGLLLKLLSNNSVNRRPSCIRNTEKKVYYRKNKIDECKRIQDEAERILKLEPEDSCEEQNMLKTLRGDLRLALATLRNE